MKLYIASHSQNDARLLKADLELRGHVVTSRWITADAKFGHGVEAYSDSERRSLATMDEDDVRASDGLILIAETEGRTVPGGKHVETGMAIALGLPVFVIGRPENLFHWHPRVTLVQSPAELLLALDKLV